MSLTNYGADSAQSFFRPPQESNAYPNPFYGIPLQFLPLHIDGMLWWAEHFLFRNGFYRTAVQRVANYFITSLILETDDEGLKEAYQHLFESIDWKEVLAKSGVNLIAFGNDFMSIQQGFERFLKCGNCGKITKIDLIENFEFKKTKYTAKCVQCKQHGEHPCIDRPHTHEQSLRTINWPVREIKIRYEDTTGEAEYYWDIPQSYIKKVQQQKDKFFARKTPQVIFECIDKKKMLVFNEETFIHTQLTTPSSIRTDGKAIPPSMFMFDDFFMLQTLKRFNEVICFEDISPFRVISAAENSNNASPVLHNNGSVWRSAVEHMVKQHKLDPAAYHIFPFPMNYQQLGGAGKSLAPVELIEQAKANILGALNIPVELYQMTLQVQAIGPALRLFENSWSCIPSAYNKILQKIANIYSKICDKKQIKVKLAPITFADDMERKSVIGQLVSANVLAKSELLETWNFNYEEQLRKKFQEETILQRMQEEEQKRQMLQQQAIPSVMSMQPQGGMMPQGMGGVPSGSTPQDVMGVAMEQAQRIFPLDGAGRRQELQAIKAQDEQLYGATKAQLEELDREARNGNMLQSQQMVGGQM